MKETKQKARCIPWKEAVGIFLAGVCGVSTCLAADCYAVGNPQNCGVAGDVTSYWLDCDGNATNGAEYEGQLRKGNTWTKPWHTPAPATPNSGTSYTVTSGSCSGIGQLRGCDGNWGAAGAGSDPGDPGSAPCTAGAGGCVQCP